MNTDIDRAAQPFVEAPEQDYGKSCPECGSDMTWEDCGACDGTGEINVYDDDPLWYDEDDTVRCNQCEGSGGYWLCLSYNKHAEPQP